MFEQFKTFFGAKSKPKTPSINNVYPKVSEPRNYGNVGHINYTPMFTVGYDGEKNPGEMGNIKKYIPMYHHLSARSWQSFTESDIVNAIVKKWVLWVVGSGLKLQSEPITGVLGDAGISVEKELFSKQVEDRFKVFAESNNSTLSGMENLHQLAAKVEKSSVLGDCLVICSVIKGALKIQAIDGEHIQYPVIGKFAEQAERRGNRIINGIEVDKNGSHVAFYVCEGIGQYKRIKAKGEKSGREYAFMVYGDQYKLNNHRGMPRTAPILETAAKLDRYKEATVGRAEEIQKIVYSIEHDKDASGEGFLQTTIQNGFNPNSTHLDDTDQYDRAANEFAQTTNKQAVNLPPGAKLAALNSDGELHFKDFFQANREIACAPFLMPPEVALSKYEQSFSSSRAALKDWEHVLNVARKNLQRQFYQKIYKIWLEIEVLNNRVYAPDYLQALVRDDFVIIEAYQNARFVGANIPHIDPMKEVNAERAKLGDAGKHAPLTTLERATEALNGGDYFANVAEFENELSQAKNLKEPGENQSS